MLKAAKRYGLIAKGFKKSLATLAPLKVPYIVFWNFNHFLVVEGFEGDQVYLNDPAMGPRTVSLATFDQAYTGVVLIMEPGPDFEPGGERPNILLALHRRLAGSWGTLLYCCLAGFLLVLPGLVLPVFSQVFIDQILVGQRQDWLYPVLLGMVMVSGLQGLLTLLQLRALRQLRIKLLVVMASQFVWHILRLPLGFYAQRFSGEISNRVGLNQTLAKLLSGSLVRTVISLIMLLFYGVVMWQYDVLLTLVGISLAIVNVVVLQLISRRRVDANLRLVQERGKVSGVSIAGLQSMETLKASGQESSFFARWSGYYAKAINAQQELEVTNQYLGVLPPLLSTFTTALLLLVGGWRIMTGAITIGMLIAFQALMQQFQRPIQDLVGFASRLQEMVGILNRLDDVLQNPIDPQLLQIPTPSLRLAPVPGERKISAVAKLKGYVELHQITFGYSRGNAPLLENLNLVIKPGQRIALVGGSGSGKSTIARLVVGLYQPWKGEIYLDGQPRSSIPRATRTSSLAFVEQDIFLFAGTIRENLTLWNTTVPDSQLFQACQDAEIHGTILAIPGGYDAQLLEGAVNLSGGQRQRLELARALVENPSILVMDEATSALDGETERKVDQNLRRRGCTCLIVAHRLSTIRDCDQIIVLDRGQVVQRGTHKDLWQQVGGTYRQLLEAEGDAWSSQ
jgi:NHLM bacteriocin system ABC transporter peptidase/ATP-binding protein